MTAPAPAPTLEFALREEANIENATDEIGVAINGDPINGPALARLARGATQYPVRLHGRPQSTGFPGTPSAVLEWDLKLGSELRMLMLALYTGDEGTSVSVATIGVVSNQEVITTLHDFLDALTGHD